MGQMEETLGRVGREGVWREEKGGREGGNRRGIRTAASREREGATGSHMTSEKFWQERSLVSWSKVLYISRNVR